MALSYLVAGHYDIVNVSGFLWDVALLIKSLASHKLAGQGLDPYKALVVVVALRQELLPVAAGQEVLLVAAQ